MKAKLLITLMLLPALLMAAGEKTGAEKNANVKFDIRYDSLKSSFTLLYVPATATFVKVKIYNEQKEVVFEEKIKAEKGFKKNFIFPNPGNYTFEIVDKFGGKSKNVEISTPLAEVKPKAKLAAFGEEKKVNLTVLNAEKSPVTVRIFNKNQELIFADLISGEHNFSRNYDFSSLNDSNYSFEVVVKNEVFKLAAK